MQRVQLADGSIEYEWVGETESTFPIDIVFLHEGLGCAAMWGRFPAALATAAGCRGLVYSRFGYGASDPVRAPRRDDFMEREAIEVLPEIISRLGVRNPILVGQSDGASIALIFAGSFPAS